MTPTKPSRRPPRSISNSPLAQLRLSKGLRQIDIVERTGLSIRTVIDYEGGKRKAHDIRCVTLIAAALAVDAGVVLSCLTWDAFVWCSTGNVQGDAL